MWRDVTNLTGSDFLAHPVWEWRAQEERELVRPAKIASIPQFSGSSPVYLAATQFVTAQGSRYLGYCSPADPSGLDYTQPVILAESGPVAIWNEQEGCVAIGAIRDALRANLDEIFPLQLKCLVPTACGAYEATIDGV